MTRAEIEALFAKRGMDVHDYPLWAVIGELDVAVAKLQQENKALWEMVDDFDTAVKKAAGRIA